MGLPIMWTKMLYVHKWFIRSSAVQMLHEVMTDTAVHNKESEKSSEKLLKHMHKF